MDRKIVIWGAGKIGRGAIASLFQSKGDTIVFVDRNKERVEQLNNQREYRVQRKHYDGRLEDIRISNYRMIHVSDKSALVNSLMDCDYMMVTVLSEDLENVGLQLIDVIRYMVENQLTKDINVLVFANKLNASEVLKRTILSKVRVEEKIFFERHFGLVNTVIIDTALTPEPEELNEYSFSLLVFGENKILLEKSALIGEPPSIMSAYLVDNIYIEMQKKLFVYNMVHAVYAYFGALRGYKTIIESAADEEIQSIAKGALDEIGEALGIQYCCSTQEIEAMKQNVIEHFSILGSEDTVDRVGRNPIKKLGKEDRLTGAVVLCKNNGVWPYYITMTIAAAFLYPDTTDVNATIIREYVDYYGIKSAVGKYCGLHKEPELLELVKEHHDRLQAHEEIEDEKKIKLMKQAYRVGFLSEKTYKGCAQCTLQGLFEMTGSVNEILYKSASGFSGGMAISGDGVCGGYAGGILFMGSIIGRRYKEMLIDGDKQDQYASYEMAQELREKYIDIYGSVICEDIHKEIFDKAYCLRTKAVRDDFEEAGAHISKCTHVIGTACAYITEILYNRGFFIHDKNIRRCING